MSLIHPAFKWAATAALTTSFLLASASASAEVSWSIGIGAPLYYEAPVPVYTPPAPVYYEPPVREYYRPPPPPPPAYYRPAPLYYGPPPVYYGPEYRDGHRHRHHEHRDWERGEDRD